MTKKRYDARAGVDALGGVLSQAAWVAAEGEAADAVGAARATLVIGPAVGETALAAFTGRVAHLSLCSHASYSVPVVCRTGLNVSRLRAQGSPQRMLQVFEGILIATP